MEKQAWWEKYLGVAQFVLLLCIAIGGAFAFWWVTLPDRQDRARIADLELWRGEMEKIQLPMTYSTQKANADIAIHSADQIRRPALEVLPRIEQSGSVDDIREIRLQINLTNIGNTDATISGISVTVDDGRPVREAMEAIRATQDYYHSLERHRHPSQYQADLDSPPNVHQADYQEPRSAEADESDDLFSDDSLDEDISVLKRRNAKTIDDIFAPMEETPNHTATFEYHVPSQIGGYETRQRFAQIPCRHGRIFAIGDGSPSIEWNPIPDATQRIARPLTLRPEQDASHEFAFVLTEYPMQHMRQWIRFGIKVEQLDAAPQEYSMLVSGLQLPPCGMQTSACIPCSQSQPCVIQPAAPLMPVDPQPARE